MDGYRIIDCDGHCVERDVELAAHADYLGKPLGGSPGVGSMPLFPSLDGWFRAASDKLSNGDPDSWLDLFRATGIELTVLHPTSGLAFGLIQDADWSVSMSRAYNNWLHQRYMRVDPRFHGLALISLHRPKEAAQELRRAVRELGMKGAVLPASTCLGLSYGHPHFYPIYEEAQKLGCVLTVHGAPSKGMGFDHFDTFIKVHTLEHPVAILIQFTSLMFDGVFCRFPELRWGFFEAGVGWVPYMMDRMDEEFEKRGKRWAPSLHRPPSEIVREAPLYFSAEVEEKTLPYAAKIVGADRIMFASDFPHERDHQDFFGDAKVLIAREDLSDDFKRAMLFDNANRFYRFGL
jgi:uncharacterized protein